MPGAGPTRVAFVSLHVSFSLHESRARREGAQQSRTALLAVITLARNCREPQDM
jgi:hypothetical protein